MEPTTITWIIVLVCGLCLGSFVTLASWRLPRGEDIVAKPSRCPACDTPLGFFDLWPILSWCASLGKCRHCHAPVSIRYPLAELVTASTMLLIYAQYGATLQALLLALLAVALLIMIVVDLEHFIIPDQIHIALVPLGLVYHYVIGTPPEDVAFGFCFGAGLGLLLHHGYRWLRHKEGLGYGDVKFFAVSGLWLGFMQMVPFLFFSGLLGVLTGLLWSVLRRGSIFPFGPSLAIALFAGVAFPQLSHYFWNVGGLIQ